MEAKFATVDNTKISYRTYGSGRAALLMLHGAVGSSNDFALQVGGEEFALNEQEFSVVAMDLPGFGQSEIPDDLKSDPTLEYFEFAAKIAGKLMLQLAHKTFAVAGWSDGARVAALVAVKYQSRVDALLLWGFVPMLDSQSSAAIARTRDTSIWDPKVLQFYTSVYGEQKFSDLWRKYVDFIVASVNSTEPIELFDVRDRLELIKCPTLVLHGSDDPIVSFAQHVKPLEMQIYDSDIQQFKGYAHNIHQANPVQFRELLSSFMSGVLAC